MQTGSRRAGTRPNHGSKKSDPRSPGQDVVTNISQATSRRCPASDPHRLFRTSAVSRVHSLSTKRGVQAPPGLVDPKIHSTCCHVTLPRGAILASREPAVRSPDDYAVLCRSRAAPQQPHVHRPPYPKSGQSQIDHYSRRGAIQEGGGSNVAEAPT